MLSKRANNLRIKGLSRRQQQDHMNSTTNQSSWLSSHKLFLFLFLLPLGLPRFFAPTFTEFILMVFTGSGAAGISSLVGITGSGTAGNATLMGITGSGMAGTAALVGITGSGTAGTSILVRIKGSGAGSLKSIAPLTVVPVCAPAPLLSSTPPLASTTPLVPRHGAFS
jgi:hypothetical protein